MDIPVITFVISHAKYDIRNHHFIHDEERVTFNIRTWDSILIVQRVHLN